MPYPPLPAPLPDNVELQVAEAQIAIQRIVARLAERLEDAGFQIDGMELDTRRFAGLRVSIFAVPCFTAPLPDDAPLFSGARHET